MQPRQTAAYRRVGASLVSACLVLLACGDSADPRDDVPPVRDSAGVEIVTGPARDRPLGIREAVRFGVIEGAPDLHFDGIRSLSLDRAGGVWVVDRHESVRRYDAAGTLVGRVGARGEGPGEAEGYGGVVAGPDELVVYGYPNVLQRFRVDGGFVEQVPASRAGGTFHFPAARVGDRWAVRVTRTDFSRRGAFRDSVLFLLGPTLDAPTDTVGAFTGELRIASQPGHVRGGSAFQGDPSFGVTASGRLVVSDTIGYRVDLLDPTGTLVRSFRRPVEPTPYDPAWEEEIRGGVRAFLGTRMPEGSPRMDEEAERIASSQILAQPPGVLPVIDYVLASPGGTLWIARADRHPRPAMRAVASAFGYVRHAWADAWLAPTVFDVFTADGRYRGTAELPPEFFPMAVEDDRVWGSVTDGLDVEYVAAYELVPPTG